jgi:hypothetical protein
VGVLATDAHRNSLPGLASDGERFDSYRRMMHWFSNYVLVPPGEIDDLTVKQAISEGRVYGAFDLLGYPAGFDFHARVGETVYEMGALVPAGAAVELRLELPRVHGLSPNAAEPAIRGVISRAEEGSWAEVASGSDALEVEVEPGVYRAEVRMIPEHLRSSLGERAEDYLGERVWVYSNPIYVGTAP